jgi:ribose 5-phosphate isomerase B
MKIAVGTDHAGYLMKEEVKKFLIASGHEVIDMGAHDLQSGDDYPDFVVPVARAVANNEVTRGIVFGGSGQGEAMVANRVKGVRATVYYGGTTDIIKLSREHNDANILSLGARFLSGDDAKHVVEMWLSTDFTHDERHARRIEKIDKEPS